jgi:hypothetical protein
MFRIILFSLIFTDISLLAQDNFKVFQDSIIEISDLAVKGESIEKRSRASKQLEKLLERILKLKDSYDYPFDSVKSIAILKSPDQAFKLFNWNELQDNGTYKYYCLIQTHDKKTNETKVFTLNDNQRKTERAIITKSNLRYPNWYGAHYYQIIYSKYKKQKSYTLLGWEGRDGLSTCKVIDILYFDKNNEPVFGLPVLPAYNEGKTYDKNIKLSRIIFEYSNQLSMSLRYIDELKMIVYDYLAPPSTEYEGKYAYYGPDMSYDALRFKKGKWVLIEDIQPKNEGK